MIEIPVNIKALMVVMLTAAVMISAIGVINAKHQARTAFVELQALKKVRDEMQVNWGRLQLEQAAWSTHGRVEQIASSRLDMILPTEDSIRVIRP
ncbi:cell division protein FtsL [Kaarinaea lacus]